MRNNPKQPDPLDCRREAIVNAALPQVLFTGWSDATLRRAAQDSGISPELLPLLFPKGAVDAVAFHSRRIDAKVKILLEGEAGFAALLVPVKIRKGILKRLELAAEHKESVRKGLSLLALPSNALLALKLLHETCDSLWQLAGDAATDLNWYTKRFTLAGVYSATVLFWLNDESVSHAETDAFLDRRLSDVKAFGQWKRKCSQSLKSVMP